MSSFSFQSNKNALVKERGSLLESLFEDSNRLAPFRLALLDDLASTGSMAAYRRHLIRRWTEGEMGIRKKKNQPPKHLTILCLQEDKEAFVAANQSVINANVSLLGEEDLPIEEVLKSDDVHKKVAAAAAHSRSGRSQSEHSSDDLHHSVLVIDSIVPLLMEAMIMATKTGKQEEVHCSVVQAATKAVAACLDRLHQDPCHFSHVVFTLHTDIFSSSYQYIELALSHISNAVIDFRHQAGLTGRRPQLFCPLVKMLEGGDEADGARSEERGTRSSGNSISSVHVQVLARKKHPRTHLKVVRRHEHFQLDMKTGVIDKFFSSDDLAKVMQQQKSISKSRTSANEAFVEAMLPESTFNLTLKKEEQVAKDSLVLPYIRKNQAGTSMNQVATTNLTMAGSTGDGGQIVYHYDQYDDFDEDDPDDDLDF